MLHMTFVSLLTAAGVQPPAAIPLPEVVKAEPASDLDKKFRRTQGWIGADGAFSVRLSEARTLWLFSDTWVGSIHDGKRKNAAIVNNTVGIQDGNGANAKITYAIQADDEGHPRPLFTPPDGKGWFWLFAGHIADGKLHVFLPRMEKTKGTGAFAFKGIDLWLGTVSNPADEPTKWKIEYKKVRFADLTGEKKRSFGAAVYRDDKHVYVYGTEQSPARPFPSRKLIVARAPVDKLADFDTWRFYANGEWKADVKDATPQVGGLGSELSVVYVAGLKRYALVYSENGLSDRIVGRFATSPEGPWSEPVLLYTCPEMKKDKKVFTYAAKAHAHLAGENELVISYAVNSFELAPVMNNADLYWPTFVRVKLK
jgi:hypothetical protein